MSYGLGQISALSYCYIILCARCIYCVSVNCIATASRFVELLNDEASLCSIVIYAGQM